MSAIQSFPLPTVAETSVAVAKPQIHDVVSASDQVLALAEQLDKEQRKRILAQVFADDLKLLVTQETDNAHKLGLAEGVKQAKAQSEQVTECLKAELVEQKSQLAELIANLKPTDLQLPVDVMPSLVNWQAEAVFRVLGHEVRDKQFLLANLKQVVAETALLQGIELHCHPVDVVYLTEPVRAHRHLNKVVANPALLPGDIRMVCGDSYVTTSLAARLQQLSAQLLDLAEYSNDQPCND
jgi:flagellar biosynthesis/type III secretory pathway protein FliH